MASNPTYCTHQELKRVYPNIDAFDTKSPVYGWTLGISDFYDSTIDIYYAANTGLITNLFIDGAITDKITYSTTEVAKLAADLDASDLSATLDTGHGIVMNDIIKIGNEYIRVLSTSGSQLVLFSTPGTNRGLFGTSAQNHSNDTSVYKIIDVGTDVADASSSGQPLSFVYDPDLDLCLLTATSNPADNLVETGEEFTSMVTQFREDASRFLDSKLDINLPQVQQKDEFGAFDYIVVRTTALIATTFLIRASDPTSEIANALMDEAQVNIDDLNSGKTSLSWQNTRDASRGVIRDVTYTTGGVRPVDTRGYWTGTFDVIKVKITTAGGNGTGKYSVWVKDGDRLGMNEGNLVVDDEIIDGDYQALSGGLQIRFGFSTPAAVAVLNDVWEIEVMGAGEHTDASGVKSVSNTRWLTR